MRAMPSSLCVGLRHLQNTFPRPWSQPSVAGWRPSEGQQSEVKWLARGSAGKQPAVVSRLLWASSARGVGRAVCPCVPCSVGLTPCSPGEGGSGRLWEDGDSQAPWAVPGSLIRRRHSCPL